MESPVRLAPPARVLLSRAWLVPTNCGCWPPGPGRETRTGPEAAGTLAVDTVAANYALPNELSWPAIGREIVDTQSLDKVGHAESGVFPVRARYREREYTPYVSDSLQRTVSV
ncbi:hypothetical protein LZ31DRAFT_559894 [Colletotrichum somersetense]|nr:hypothetical protein LZ31DRAFT_559894 [Colletotrichum somersetense]